MTALKKFEKIEAVGIWRADEEAQRRDVIVTLGDASLTILDMHDRVLAHWSIPAIARANPGQRPAIFHPDGDPGETLEMGDESSDLIDAIETLRKAVAKRRPHPGRLRITSALVIVGAVAALGVFWLPGAVLNQTLSVLPGVKQREIGGNIVISARRFTGVECSTPAADIALEKVASRIAQASDLKLHVVPDGLTDTLALPGYHFLIGRSLVEDHETPEVLIGYLLAENRRAGGASGTIRGVLESASFLDNVKLLTTGSLPEDRISNYAEDMLSTTRQIDIDTNLLSDFEAVRVSSRPFAYALDVTGETTLDLIEADPMATQNPLPILSDGEWVALQGICEN